MNSRALWITGLTVLATGVAWAVLLGSREADAVRGERSPTAERDQAEPRTSGPLLTGQRTVMDVPDEAQPPVVESQATKADEPPLVPRSPFARDLDDVAASFLTAQPRVTDLLDLVDKLAAGAVVDPDSVAIQRGHEGELLSARGAFAIGDVRGTFQVDRDGYRVLIRSEISDASWSQRDIAVSFEESDARPRGCHALVQFHPGAAGPSAGVVDEKLVGWSVGTSPEVGTIARPLTLGIAEGEWRIRDSTKLQMQEFPWITDISGFTAWLERLGSYVATEPGW